MGNIDNIVDVKISLESPALDSASFSSILLVVQKPPKVGTEEMPDVAVVRSAKELEAFGYGVADEAYIAASVAFNQDPRPGKVYIIARSAGTSEGVSEDIAVCMDRAMSRNEWYGFSLAFTATATETEAAAKWAEANDKLFGFTYTNGECPISLGAYNNTFGFFAGSLVPQPEKMPDGNKYAAVACMAKCFGYDPGTETWALKTLNGVTPSHLSTTQMQQLTDEGANYYITVANKDVTQDGRTGSGEWVDVVRFMHWLVNEVQMGVFQFMVKNPKVAFNDGGITGIHNAVQSVLKGAQGKGIDEDAYDEDGNVFQGFTVSVPRAYKISAAKKKMRKLEGVTFTARLSGAIHITEIRGTLEY